MSKTKWYAKPVYFLVAAALVLSLAVVAVPLAEMVQASPDELHVGPGQTYVTIQAAIGAAKSGDTVIVHPGTYDESVSISTNNLIVKAQNRATTEGATENAIVSPASGNGFTVNADGVTIDGFEIADINGVGISFVGSDNIFQYNLIHDLIVGGGIGAYKAAAIYSYTLAGGGSDNNQILNNTIYNCNGGGIHYGSGDTKGTDDTNEGGIISNNTMYNLGTGDGITDSIYILDGKNFIISGNNITGSSTQYYGIDVSIQDGDVADDGGHQILNNTVTGHFYCIYVWTIGTYVSANNLVISGNDVSSANYHGIVLSNRTSFGPISGSTISENEIYNNPMKGIILGANVHDNVISNNTIENNGHGIWIEGDNNQIIRNDILNNTLAVDSGIHLTTDASSNIIHFNNIVGNSDVADNYGVFNGAAEMVDAENNWWGDASGPTHAGNSGGTGDAVSDNVDYEPWLGEQYAPIKSTATATGTGDASFSPDEGALEGLTAVNEGDLPEEGKPALEFPHGFFSFNIVGLSEGQEVVITITLPEDVPVGTQYWKHHASEGGWIEIPMGSDDGDNMITITLVDGGLGDDDAVPNGTIVDAGGPGNPPPPPPEYTITFDTDPEATGNITFDGVSYSDGDTASKTAATYDIEANPGSGYNFDSWETTGDLSVTAASSATTTCDVSGDGTLRMVQTTAPPPPPPVGGEAFPPNKLAILAPWIALAVAIIAGSAIFIRRRRVQG